MLAIFAQHNHSWEYTLRVVDINFASLQQYRP